MPIQIPFHSQAAPGVVPNAGARAMPGGFGSLQQAAKMPLNDQRATADMFSGGLQGLQGLGQALGNVGQGFFQIAAKMRQLDDYQIKTDEMEAGAALDYGMAEATAEFKNDPDGLQLRYDELNQQYRAAVLDRDMPADVRAELERKVLLRTSSDKTNMLVNRLEDKMSQASTRAGTSIMKNVADGNTPGAHAAIDLAVEGGVMDAATGERLHLVEGQKSEYNRFVKDADAAADDLSGERPVELNIDNYGLSEEQRSRAGVYQQRAQNKAENRLLEQMISSPDDFTAEVVDDLVQRKYMEPSTAARWKDSLTKAPLPPDSPEVQAVWRMVNSYVPGADSDTLEARNAIMIEMSAISPRASESVALMRTALGNRVRGYEKMLEITLERFEKTIKALDDGDDKLSTDRENILYNRMAEEIRGLSKQRPEATAEELYEQSKVKFEVFKGKSVKEIKQNPEKVRVRNVNAAVDTSKIPTPLAPHVATFQKAGEENGIDPKFLIAISMFETGGGKSSAFRNKKNAMGVSNSKGPITFNSKDDSILSMARKLASSKGPYRNANTIAEIGAIYSPPGAGNDPNGTNHSWPSQVAAFYRKLGGDPSKPVKGI